jgi:hypothetical protein
MPSIDGVHDHCIQEVMSRPIRPFFPVILLAGAVGLTGCVGTIYDRTYSYKRNYFKPDEDKKEASAESILGALDQKPDAGAPDAAVLPPPDVPGLPPAGLPAPDAGVPAPPPPAAAPAAK